MSTAIMEETIELYDLPHIAQNKSASYVRLATMVTEAKQKLKVCKSVFAKDTLEPSTHWTIIARYTLTADVSLVSGYTEKSPECLARQQHQQQCTDPSRKEPGLVRCVCLRWTGNIGGDLCPYTTYSHSCNQVATNPKSLPFVTTPLLSSMATYIYNKALFAGVRFAAFGSQAEVDEKMYNNSQLERKLCNLDDTLPLQEKQIQNISQIYEEKCVEMNKIQWQQTKAEIVAAKEEEYEEKYFQTAKKLKVMETTFTDGDIQIQNETRKKKVLKLKTILQEKKMSTLDDLKAKKDEMANNLSQEVARVERENSVLKKRNIAFLLRTQKQLKEEEFAYQHLALQWNHMSTM
uniref:Uncharacterized protein n=1 Tax=Timema cristinae TaxID=61476 RepID=A0A7R9H998_TIMCR|nr:unnamed protein product [Timema cristinae]